MMRATPDARPAPTDVHNTQLAGNAGNSGAAPEALPTNAENVEAEELIRAQLRSSPLANSPPPAPAKLTFCHRLLYQQGRRRQNIRHTVLRSKRSWHAVCWPPACTEQASLAGRCYYLNTISPVSADAFALELSLGSLPFSASKKLWADGRVSRGNAQQTTCDCGLAWPFYCTGACPRCVCD